MVSAPRCASEEHLGSLRRVVSGFGESEFGRGTPEGWAACLPPSQEAGCAGVPAIFVNKYLSLNTLSILPVIATVGRHMRSFDFAIFRGLFF